ncbi:MAG: NADPH-dependent FMN reductase [Tsuneonella suprasediminis]|nr:NAD(P)H-dependent oxidoreductase [Altererythrobacter sp. N1]
MKPINLLGISGSLRAGSFSTAILRTLQSEMPEGVTLTLHPLGDVPLYNQDLDTDQPPAGVAALREAIARADGLVIVTPEFNYGLPGVLKNALDWASRPHGKAALTGKPTVTMSASPAFTGGVRAQSQLHETLIATQTALIARPQVVIAEVHNKLVDGRLTDAPSLGFARDAISDLVKAIEAQ